MLLVSKEDVAVHIHQCIQLTAKRLGLQEIEWKDSDDLFSEIEEMDGSVYATLQAYFTAYRQWHDFHVWIETHGKASRLDDHEKKRLKILMQERDDKRQAIIALLDIKAPIQKNNPRGC